MGADARYSVRCTCGVSVTLLEGSWGDAVRFAIDAYRRGETPIRITDLASGEVVATHAAIGEWLTWDALRRTGTVAS